MSKLYTDDWLQRHDFTLTSGEAGRYWRRKAAKPASHTALFVHGMKGNHAGLSGLAWEYAKIHPEADIVLVDLPGFGGSQPFTDTRDLLGQYRQFIAEVCSLLAAPRYTLIGHSFGAIVAYDYLAHTQDRRVTNCYLFGTHVSGKTANGRMLGLYHASAKVLPKGLQQRYLYSRWVNRLESMYFTKVQEPTIRKQIYAARIGELDFKEPRTLMASIKSAANVDLRKLPIPKHTHIVFVHGRKDNVAALGPIKQLAIRNNAPIFLLPRVGHYLVNEDAARSAKVFEPGGAPAKYGIIELA